MGRKSISQRIKTVRPERRVEVATNWAAEWQAEYEEHVRNFEKAIRTEDFDLLARTLGWLKADGKKRFDALPRVFVAMADRQSGEGEGDDRSRQVHQDM